MLLLILIIWIYHPPPKKVSLKPNSYNTHPLIDSELDVAKYLTQSFTSLSQSHHKTSPYHPSLTPLYTHFITLLIDVCFPFIHNPYELQYIAAARWPGFVKPVLDEYERERDADRDMDMDMDAEEEEEEEKAKKMFIQPSEHTRMRLNRLFNSSLTNALQALHPRLTNATDWAQANQPESNLLSKPLTQPHPQSKNELGGSGTTNILKSLPRISKFILVASFLASTNPAKSDMRMFGRGLDEKKRKRRITGRKKTTTAAKVAPPFFFFSSLDLSRCLFTLPMSGIGPAKTSRSCRFRIR